MHVLQLQADRSSRFTGAVTAGLIMNPDVYKRQLMPFIGCLIGVTIVMGVLRFLFQVAFETASQGVLYDMRDKVYRKLLEEDFAFYNKKRTGDLMSRQTGDMDAIRQDVYKRQLLIVTELQHSMQS